MAPKIPTQCYEDLSFIPIHILVKWLFPSYSNSLFGLLVGLCLSIAVIHYVSHIRPTLSNVLSHIQTSLTACLVLLLQPDFAIMAFALQFLTITYRSATEENPKYMILFGVTNLLGWALSALFILYFPVYYHDTQVNQSFTCSSNHYLSSWSTY